MRSKERRRSAPTQAFEDDQVFIRGSRRISPRRAVAANGCKRRFLVGIRQIGDERVGMLCGKAMGS